MQVTERPKRRLHETDFRGKPFWMRVPTMLECIQAELKAAQWLKDQVGPEEPIDPEIWTVSTATAFVLAHACVDADGNEQLPGSMMLSAHTQDELLELLHKLSGFRLAESKNPPLVSDDEVEAMALTLSGCSELDAYSVCAGINHETMVRIALGMSRLLASQARAPANAGQESVATS